MAPHFREESEDFVLLVNVIKWYMSSVFSYMFTCLQAHHCVPIPPHIDGHGNGSCQSTLSHTKDYCQFNPLVHTHTYIHTHLSLIHSLAQLSAFSGPILTGTNPHSSPHLSFPFLSSVLFPHSTVCVTTLFSDIEKEGPKWLWQPWPRRRRLGRPQPRVWGQVQENKWRHWSDDQQTETVCKYRPTLPELSSHPSLPSLSFFSFFLPFSIRTSAVHLMGFLVGPGRH